MNFGVGLVKTSRFDQVPRLLADRHYSRTSVGNPQFVGPGRVIVLRDAAGLVVFAWRWQLKDRPDGRIGYECAIFRNESKRLSSEIILEAAEFAALEWGPGPAFTYVDPLRVASENPGYCFKVAGWKSAGYSRSGKLALEKRIGVGP